MVVRFESECTVAILLFEALKCVVNVVFADLVEVGLVLLDFTLFCLAGGVVPVIEFLVRFGVLPVCPAVCLFWLERWLRGVCAHAPFHCSVMAMSSFEDRVVALLSGGFLWPGPLLPLFCKGFSFLLVITSLSQC